MTNYSCFVLSHGIVIIMFADTPLVRAESIATLVSKVEDGAAIAVAAFQPADPSGYGRLVKGKNGVIESIVEERDASDEQRLIGLCNGGIMAARTPLLFDLLDRVTNDNAKGEYYLTDMTESLEGKKIDVSLRWEQMTTIGPYYSGMEHIGEFTMPDKIMEGKRRQSRPGPGSRVENY